MCNETKGRRLGDGRIYRHMTLHIRVKKEHKYKTIRRRKIENRSYTHYGHYKFNTRDKKYEKICVSELRKMYKAQYKDENRSYKNGNGEGKCYTTLSKLLHCSVSLRCNHPLCCVCKDTLRRSIVNEVYQYSMMRNMRIFNGTVILSYSDGIDLEENISKHRKALMNIIRYHKGMYMVGIFESLPVIWDKLPESKARIFEELDHEESNWQNNERWVHHIHFMLCARKGYDIESLKNRLKKKYKARRSIHIEEINRNEKDKIFGKTNYMCKIIMTDPTTGKLYRRGRDNHLDCFHEWLDAMEKLRGFKTLTFESNTL